MTKEAVHVVQPGPEGKRTVLVAERGDFTGCETTARYVQSPGMGAFAATPNEELGACAWLGAKLI